MSISIASFAVAAFVLSGVALAGPQPGCSASAVSPWPSAGEGFTIEATTAGPTCAQAVATIVARKPDGEAVWADALVAQYVMVLSGMPSLDEMKPALGDWVDQRTVSMKTTGDLPEWKAEHDQPGNEFVFYPAEGIDRDTYNAIRDSKQPMFCYVQGMESMRCIARDKDGGAVTDVGIQTFPG